MAGERSDLGKIFITDGGIYDANTTYEKLTMVSYNNSTYITLRTVTGVTPSNDRINYGLMAQGFTATYLSSVTAEDVQGLVVEAGSETPAQSLINAIADRVANQLVSNSDLQDILGDYILKSAIANNLSITEEGKVLDARQGKALNDALGKWIFGGSTESFRVANNSTATDIAMRAIHSNGAYSSLTVAENKIELLSADSGGNTTQKLCVLFDHLQVACNGSATTSVTLTHTLINYTARRILACVNGGSDNGAYITKAIPVGTKTVDLYWSKALPTSGPVHVTLLYW